MNVRGFLVNTILILAVCTVSTAQAQGVKLAMNAGGVLPVSDLKDTAGAGFAANVYLAYMFSEKLGIEGHVGYHQFAAEQIAAGVEVGGVFIPIKVGVVKLWGKSKRFYTNPSVGIYSGDSDFNGSDFGMGPKVGFLFPLGEGNATLDLGFEFHNVFSDPENSRYFGVTLGAVFSLSGE